MKRQIGLTSPRLAAIHLANGLILCSILCFLLLAASYTHADTSKEAKLKAAVIVGILRFTSWQQPIPQKLKICGQSQNKTIKELTVSAPKLRIKGVPMEIHADPKLSELASCNVFIFTQKTAVSPLALSNSLTICDGCSNVDHKLSDIVLIKKANHIRFTIDLQKTRASGISFSSTLLELATKVKGVR